MKQIINCIRKKSQLIYDMNCIEKYIEGGDYDKNLKKTWDNYNKQLKAIDKEIEEIRIPELLDLHDTKLELLSQVKEYEDKIKDLKQQLKDLDKIVLQLNK